MTDKHDQLTSELTDISNIENSHEEKPDTSTPTIHEIRKDNLVRAIKDKYDSINDFATNKKIEAAPIYKIQNGSLKMGEKAARKYEKLLGLEPFQLDQLNSQLHEKKYISIPVHAPVLSAGNGTPVFSEERVDELAIPTTIIKLKDLNIKNLVAFRVKGDSMADTINDKAYVVVDTSQKDIEDGKIYALSVDNEVIVKRLFHMLDGILIKSDNKNYPEQKVTDNTGFINIIGKIKIILNIS